MYMCIYVYIYVYTDLSNNTLHAKSLVPTARTQHPSNQWPPKPRPPQGPQNAQSPKYTSGKERSNKSIRTTQWANSRLPNTKTNGQDRMDNCQCVIGTIGTSDTSNNSNNNREEGMLISMR